MQQIICHKKDGNSNRDDGIEYTTIINLPTYLPTSTYTYLHNYLHVPTYTCISPGEPIEYKIGEGKKDSVNTYFMVRAT